MWNGSLCMRKTETGLPCAAHTPLKLTPAAMTSTSTSLGPSSGTGTSSTCIDCIGSPSRSLRMTIACIVSGRLAERRRDRVQRQRASSVPPLRVRVRVIADQLDQDSVGRLGMQEADLVAARARARHLVDERHAARVELAQRAGQIVDGEGDVVQPRLAPCCFSRNFSSPALPPLGAMSSTVQPAVSGVRMNAASVFCASTNSRGPAEQAEQLEPRRAAPRRCWRRRRRRDRCA